MKAYRCDIGLFRRPVKTAQGYLKADGLATRVGIFRYKLPDGTIQRELRPPDEVFDENSLETLSAIPVTNDHPPVMLDSENTKQFSVGFTHERVDVDDDFVKVGMTVTDKNVIDDILERNREELSCGYHADLEITPGIYKGEPYDAVQRNIRYNHLAIVDRGRAGREARIRLDKDQGVMVEEIKEEIKMDNKDNKTGVSMAKIKLDGIEYEVSESLGKVVMDKQSALEKSQADLEATQKKVSELKGRCDSLEQEIEKAKKDKPSRKALLKEARNRIDLEHFGKEVLGDEAKFDDETSDTDIRKQVLKKLQPKLTLDDREGAYIQAAFDVAQGSYEKKDAKGEQLKKNLGNGADKNDGADGGSVASRNKMIEDSLNAWKPQA